MAIKKVKKAKAKKKKTAKRGRPVHVPTEKNRKIVREAWQKGHKKNYISTILLGIDKETLAKHYEDELKEEQRGVSFIGVARDGMFDLMSAKHYRALRTGLEMSGELLPENSNIVTNWPQIVRITSDGEEVPQEIKDLLNDKNKD